MTYIKSDTEDGAWAVWELSDDKLTLIASFDGNRDDGSAWREEIPLDEMITWQDDPDLFGKETWKVITQQEMFLEIL